MGDVILRLGTQRGVAGWYALLEIDKAMGRARFCAYRFTDVSGRSCPETEVVCAAQGSLVLTHIPATAGELPGIMGRVVGTFSTGLDVHIDFRLPQ
jgi:hypothetical protein